MRTQRLHPQRSSEHPERHMGAARARFTTDGEVLQPHAHRGDQVDVAEEQRGRPDPELLHPSEGLKNSEFRYRRLGILPLLQIDPLYVFRSAIFIVRALFRLRA